MFARRLASCCAALALGLAVSGCNRHERTAPRLALLAASDGLGGTTGSAQAASGLRDCANATGASATAVPASPPDDYEGGLVLLATEAFDPVIAVGSQMTDAVAAAARRFNDTHFDLLDGSVDEPNVTSVRFADEQGAFVAGALAALVTHTKHVAFLGGRPIARLAAIRVGFTAGAHQVDGTVRVDTRFAGSFEAESAGRDAARALVARGADVVYVVAGRAGLGAIAELHARRGRYAIGVDADQDAYAPGTVLASVVKRFDVAASTVCLESASQKTTIGELRLGLAQGAIGLTRSRYARAIVTAPIIARLQRIEDAIVRGTLVVPSDAAAAARFKPVPLPDEHPAQTRRSARAAG